MALNRLRQRVGMVFQTPNPLPMSIYKNIAFPLTLMGEKDRTKIAFRVEAALKKAYLWDEVSVRVIEDLLLELKKSCTIILVSHYMDQIRRIADHCLVLSDRRLRPDTAKGRDI